MMTAIPKLNASYWLVLILASVFGANAGDFVSDVLGLGHLKGLPILAALLAAIFVIDRIAAAANVYAYWAAIITIRAAATNIGDSFHDAGITFDYSIPFVFVLLIALVFAYRRSRGNAISMPVNAFYWLCMCCVGVLGTIGGDYLAYAVRLGSFWATIVSAIVVALLLSLRSARARDGVFLFWFTVAAIRAGGTVGGDFLASRVFGLTGSTACTGIVFVLAVLLVYGRDRRNFAGDLAAVGG